MPAEGNQRAGEDWTTLGGVGSVGVLVLDHPYPEGTRVRHAGDDSVGARAAGTARIVEPVAGTSGDLDYKVRTDQGGETTWPAYFTIPVGETPVGRHSEYATAAHA